MPGFNAIAARLDASARPAVFHLGASVLVALAVLALIFLLWYPGEMAELQGARSIVLILLAVDVLAGPLLTLIVFDPAKKRLWFDLAVITSIQTAALLYGVRVLEGGRPVYVVFNVDRFDVISRNDVSAESLRRADSTFGISILGPRWLAAELPEDTARRSSILFSAIAGGPDLPQMPEFYVNLDGQRAEMIARARPAKELRDLNAVDHGVWDDMVAKLKSPDHRVGYLPLRARARDAVVFLDTSTGELLGIRMLVPSFERRSGTLP